MASKKGRANKNSTDKGGDSRPDSSVHAGRRSVFRRQFEHSADLLVDPDRETAKPSASMWCEGRLVKNFAVALQLTATNSLMLGCVVALPVSASATRKRGSRILAASADVTNSVAWIGHEVAGTANIMK